MTTRNPGLLARLFGRRGRSPIVAQLYAATIGQPLLVHPQIGEQLIGAYLHGAIEARPATMETIEITPANTGADGVLTMARRVAVLNVSGGLANRFAGDMCDPGPLSYEVLRQAFDRAMADESVTAIVMRFETPGGMGAGLFELTDHINANRGRKPIYAVLDDYAYSAGYALAAACDEIWITRTGGAGSVGVIGYHVDQSAWDAKVGVKITAIYSGAHKNDFSPHAALGEEAGAWMQTRMDDMRQLFAESVARYRGLELDAVLATEAQVYQGQAAIDVGFADRLGNFHELMAELSSDPDDERMRTRTGAATNEPRTEVPVTEPLAAPPAIPTAAAFAAAISASTLAPAIGMALLRRGPRESDASASIRYAQDVHDACAAAGIESVAADYIKAGSDLETVRAQLIAAKAEDGPELITSQQPKAKAGGDKPMHVSVYERRRAAG